MPARNTPFEKTIDWDEYWTNWSDKEDETYAAVVSGGHFERIQRVFEQVGVPSTAAFVGCGRSSLPVKIGTAYPDMRVVGYDAARSVIEQRQDEQADVTNVTFKHAVLPEFAVDQRYEFVLCYSTLHYVREIERAIENLYAAIHSDGHLVFNYPNQAFQEDHQHAEGHLRKRFQLALNGVNLLSKERIEDILGVEIRDFWDVVDADGPFAQTANPCVMVDKSSSRVHSRPGRSPSRGPPITVITRGKPTMNLESPIFPERI